MNYESDIIAALGLTAPANTAPATVQSAWTRLQDSITAWRAMHGISHQSMGSGPSVGMFEDKLAQMVSIDLRVYRNALAAAGLTGDPRQAVPPMGAGMRFDTREVCF